MSCNIKGFIAICNEAQRLGWPEAFKDDLKINDARVLMAEDAPQEFGWGIRNSGTDIFLPGREGYLDFAYSCLRYRTNSFYYWYSGCTLQQISPQQLIDKMIEREAAHADK